MEITDNDLKMFQERSRTELTGCGTGSIAWDSVIWDLCHEVRRLREALTRIAGAYSAGSCAFGGKRADGTRGCKHDGTLGASTCSGCEYTVERIAMDALRGEVAGPRSAAKESGDVAKLHEVVGDLLYMAERYLKKTPATESVIFDPETKKEVRTINYYAVIEKARSILSGGGTGAADKEPPAETRVRKVLMVDDFPGMRGYIEKCVPNVEVTYCARLPDDESVFAQYDALVIDGDGVGNRTYPDGLAFCKAYDKPEGQAVVYHSGLRAYGEDAMILEHRGIANLMKGYPEKLALCIRFPMPKLIGGADKKPVAFKVGDRVSWADPTTGVKTDGWTVLDVPEIPDEGPSGDGVYRIENDSGFEEEAHARELSYPEGRPL